MVPNSGACGARYGWISGQMKGPAYISCSRESGTFATVPRFEELTITPYSALHERLCTVEAGIATNDGTLNKPETRSPKPQSLTSRTH